MRQGWSWQRRETNRTSGGRTAGVGPCPNAGLLQVAVARNGLGAVAWRSVRWPEPEVQRFSVQASDLADGRFGAPPGKGGPVVAGAAFAIAWTPCVGPTLGAILSAAALTASVGHAAVLLGFYSAGLAIPFWRPRWRSGG